MTGFIFDIDGVLTDGKIWVNNTGSYSKCVNMKDIDAIYELSRRGYGIYAVTAEKNEFTQWIKERFPWNEFYEGVSDKGEVIKKIKSGDCGFAVYIGDGKKDIIAFDLADYKVCPYDAIIDVRKKADYVLKNCAGTGVLWDLLELCTYIEKLVHFNGIEIWKSNLKHHQEVFNALLDDKEYQKSFISAANLLCTSLFDGRRAVIFGNGGSASDAQHIAAEFLGKYKTADVLFDMEALSVNTSLITAIGNDFKFDDVFSRQIRGMLKKGDVALGISTSGKSANVIKALDLAKAMGVYTILLTGNNKEEYEYDAVLKVPSSETPRIQEMHILTGHSLAEYVEEAYLQRIGK